MMINQLTRWYKFKCNAIITRIDVWILKWDQYRCPHRFRPARVNDKPARVCKICDHIELLTREEFFAYFGELGEF